MLKHNFLLVLMLTQITILQAQKEISISDTQAKFDTNYIRSFSDNIGIKLYGIIKDNKIEIRDKILDQKVLYSPNENFNIGLGLNYKWLRIAAAFNLPFINQDDDIYGKTEKLDLQVNTYGRRLIFDANFQYYKGYYIENPSDYIENWNNPDSFPKRSDLKSSSLGASCYYSFNHKRLSYRSSFTQSERQEKSAGSFLLGNYFSIYLMETDTNNGIVPDEIKDTFDMSLDLIKASSYDLGVAAGYIHNFAIRKKFYITLSLLTGISLHSFSGETTTTDTLNSESKLALRIQTRLATGYNGDRFYTGISYVGDNYSLNSSENFEMSYGFGNFRIFIGTRFDFRKKKKQKDLSFLDYKL